MTRTARLVVPPLRITSLVATAGGLPTPRGPRVTTIEHPTRTSTSSAPKCRVGPLGDERRSQRYDARERRSVRFGLDNMNPHARTDEARGRGGGSDRDR